MLKAPDFGRKLVYRLHFCLLRNSFISVSRLWRRSFLRSTRVYNSGAGIAGRFLRRITSAFHIFKQQHFVYWCRVSVSRVNVLISKNRSAPDVNISNSSWSARSYLIPPVFLQNLCAYKIFRKDWRGLNSDFVKWFRATLREFFGFVKELLKINYGDCHIDNVGYASVTSRRIWTNNIYRSQRFINGILVLWKLMCTKKN